MANKAPKTLPSCSRPVTFPPLAISLSEYKRREWATSYPLEGMGTGQRDRMLPEARRMKVTLDGPSQKVKHKDIISGPWTYIIFAGLQKINHYKK